jgi:hypothetical protein
MAVGVAVVALLAGGIAIVLAVTIVLGRRAGVWRRSGDSLGPAKPSC